jgi:hypothetical protein
VKIVVENLWHQKDHTPSDASGDFHWHPPLARVEDLVSSFRKSGPSQGPFSFWCATERGLLWLRTFRAVYQPEQRAYEGLAGVFARPDDGEAATRWPRLLPALLQRLSLPPAAPAAGAARGPAGFELDLSAAEPAPAPESWAPFELEPKHARSLARALCFGSHVQAPAATDERLPALVGALLATLPGWLRALPCSSAFVSFAPEEVQRAADEERLAYYVAQGWLAGRILRESKSAAFPAHVWALFEHLASATASSRVDLMKELGTLTNSWTSRDAFSAYLASRGLDVKRALACRPWDEVQEPGELWSAVVNHWSRTDEIDVSVLARVLAHRVLADHLGRLDEPERAKLPTRYLARLGTEALISKNKLADLSAALSLLLPAAVIENPVLGRWRLPAARGPSTKASS